MDSWSFDALTPTSFLTRTATVYPDRIAIIDGDRRFTYGEMLERCANLAGSLYALTGGRPVAVLAPNSHTLFEAHYAVPWSGSPLVALNSGSPRPIWSISCNTARPPSFSSTRSTPRPLAPWLLRSGGLDL